MMLNRQLKAGLLDSRDYTLARQNLEDSYGHLKTISQKAQEESSLTIKGINDGTLIAGLTGAVQGDLDDFQQWNKTKAYINPNTGVMSIGRVDDNGKLLDGASNYTTLEGFANQIRVRFDRWDYATDLQSKTDALGKQIELEFQRDPRGYKSFEDFKRKFAEEEGFDTYLDKTVQAINSSDIRKISVLEEIGEYNVKYDLNATKTKVDGDTITVGFKTNNDGTKFPVLDEDGKIKEVTDDFLKLQFRSMLDYEEGFQKVASDETAYETKAKVEAGAGDEAEDTYVTTIAQLYTGDENEKRKAAQSILNLQPGGRNISNINVTDRGVVFEYTEDGQPATQEFSFYDDNVNLMSQADFIESMGTFGGITSIDQALSRGSFDPNAQFSDAQTSVSETARQQESPLEAFERIVTGPEYQFDATLFVEDNEDATKENIQKLISSIPGSKGYSVEAIGGVLSDAIAVNDPDGNRIAELDLNDPLTDSSGGMRREVQAFIDAITGSIIGNVDKDVLEQVTSGQLQMKGAGGGGGMGGF
jgi:hypothetical protein